MVLQIQSNLFLSILSLYGLNGSYRINRAGKFRLAHHVTQMMILSLFSISIELRPKAALFSIVQHVLLLFVGILWPTKHKLCKGKLKIMEHLMFIWCQKIRFLLSLYHTKSFLHPPRSRIRIYWSTGTKGKPCCAMI